jgi:hypothetical protein
MTRGEFARRWAQAESAGPEAVTRLKTSVARQTVCGIARGGPPCCGTTGIWHLPWCHAGPWEPEP